MCLSFVDCLNFLRHKSYINKLKKKSSFSSLVFFASFFFFTYPSDSVRSSLFKVKPLILTAATESLMLFTDRFFLAQHSLDAMNGASAVFLVTAIFVFFGVAIAAASEGLFRVAS